MCQSANIPDKLAFQLFVALNYLVDEARASGQPLGEWASNPFMAADQALNAMYDHLRQQGWEID